VLNQLIDARFLYTFAHMTLTYNLSALVSVPNEVMKALPPNLEIIELTREHKEHRKTYWFFS
jgi:hypothetical protein